MNLFGGDWTERKIEIVEDYAKAYLTIFNKYPQFKTLYFDGFAGSGDIYLEDEIDMDSVKGTAIRILEINAPKSFDIYYFVEKNVDNKLQLESYIREKFPEKKTHIVCEDCNVKMKNMSEYLQVHSNVRGLAFIDPYGMFVDWSAIDSLKNCNLDMWILVPTGIGLNRLLQRNGQISEAWLNKIERFLGLERHVIIDFFYKRKKENTLFGEESFVEKEKSAITMAANLYRSRLNEIFEFVSNPYELTNSTGSVMYHFMMATNNSAGLRIANDILKKR